MTGLRDRLPLLGVGAAAQLVNEHEAAFVRLADDGNDVADMGGKGGEVLLDRLRVADVAEHVAEHGDLGAVRRGDKQPAARHQAEQPAHFQRHRLAAGVRAGNEQEFISLSQRDGDGHRRLRVEQRMPPLFDAQHSLRVEPRAHGAGTVAVFRFGEGGVDLGEKGNIRREVVRQRADAAGKRRKDALDLFLLRRGKLAQLVVHFEHFFRLDEKGGAARRTVVDEPADARLILRAHRQDVAVVAHGDDALAQELRAVARKIFGEARADALVEGTDGAADIEERLAGIVAHFLFGEDLFPDIFFQRGIEAQPLRKIGQQRELPVRQRAHGTRRDARGAQQRGDGEQLPAGEGCALARPAQFLVERGEGLHFSRAVRKESGVRLGGEREQRLRLRKLRARLLRPQRVLCLRERSVFRRRGKYLVQFEFFEDFPVHFSRLPRPAPRDGITEILHIFPRLAATEAAPPGRSGSAPPQRARRGAADLLPAQQRGFFFLREHAHVAEAVLCLPARERRAVIDLEAAIPVRIAHEREIPPALVGERVARAAVAGRAAPAEGAVPQFHHLDASPAEHEGGRHARGAYLRERKFFGKGDLFRIFPRRERGGAAEEIESRARKEFQPLFAAERYGEGALGIDSFKSRKVYARNVRVGTESRQIQVFMPGIIL